MDRYKIDISEIGYGIYDVESNKYVIEGISEWCVACELHEMVSGELD
ncbi:MAG: hypothetical protein HQL50_04905 [Magnetococcales bacterium]|nr:hypothetical protein [Magnetococcales bacterium]